MLLTNNADLTIARLSGLIRRRKLSPVELTDFVLARIHRLQQVLNAFITITEKEAKAQAMQAEKEISKGQYRGPLHGIPISLKDLICTRGVRTTAASRILQHFVPDRNAAVVDRLFQAGAILLGKTNLHEFAYGVTNVNPHYGPVRNAWDVRRISGGSSGGSAVSVSAALALASLGTDTGGSIRIPASACGCVGLKPTYGLVPLDGVIPLAPSLDHIGPITRCVEDAGILLSAISTPGASRTRSDALSARNRSRKIKGLKVGIPRQYFFDRIQSGVRAPVLGAVDKLEELGAEILEVDLKGINDTAELASDITVAEALAYHWKWLPKRSSEYGADIRTRMQESKAMPVVTYLLAQERRRAYCEIFSAVFDAVDVLAVPTLPIVAPLIEEERVSLGRSSEDVRTALLRLTRPANLTGLPAISVPCGFSAGRLPVGLQLIGRRFEEGLLLRAARAYEESVPWHTSFPPELTAASAAGGKNAD